MAVSVFIPTNSVGEFCFDRGIVFKEQSVALLIDVFSLLGGRVPAVSAPFSELRALHGFHGSVFFS